MMHTIYQIGMQETLCYAARELASYLTLITGEDCFEIQVRKAYEENLEGIWLGIDEELGLQLEAPDRVFDDAIAIKIQQGKGFIAGSNPRSILIGVYRFLTELGCRWIRPCKDGEVLVYKPLEAMNVMLEDAADLRHRGIVIEGANSYQNVVDLIEWMPKLGYNSYFIQFKHAYAFFKQWYAHEENPLKRKEFFDDEMAKEFTQGLRKELQKRGLIEHAVGHGWTCEAIGIEGRGWGVEDGVLTEAQKECLALTKGERQLWGGIPLNTNLCYSEERVQAQMTAAVVDYAKEHPNADVLHVWVADDFNNHCECEKCGTLTPTDWYVQILNRLDEQLSKEGLSTRIAFLLYFELLWTPIKERLHHPERFVMMFAPISRTFNKSYKSREPQEKKVSRYPLNQVKLPSEVEDYRQLLEEWQALFAGDSFDFDYHLGRAHYGDPGYCKISQIISEDIKELKGMQLNGLMSCQEQRAFFPTALPNYTMGKTLWDTSLSFEEIAEDYFRHAFGEEGDVCQAYLENISAAFEIDYWHLGGGKVDESFANQVASAQEIVHNFREVVMRHKPHLSKTQALSWKYLVYHLDYTELLAAAFEAKARGQKELADEKWTAFADYICENEDELQSVLDVFRILRLGGWLGGFVRHNVGERK
ncbi:MAG: DUF4838 domain-containing protein [Niameybacter sp.]